MWWFSQIISYLAVARDRFYNAYITTSNWVWPFNLLSTPLYYLYFAFHQLVSYFSYFSGWVTDAASKLIQILNWSTIWSFIVSYVPNLTSLNTWFYDWWGSVTGVVTSWWSSTQFTVQGWIDILGQFLQTQINSLSASLTNLQADITELLAQLPNIDILLAWLSDWWANILTEIEVWWNGKLLGVQELINSNLRDWFPFYDDLVELWSDIKLFFTDPLQWLYNELDEFFERFW